MCGDNYEHLAVAAAAAAAGLVVLEYYGDAVAADEESARYERAVVFRVVDDLARSSDRSKDWRDRKHPDYRCQTVLDDDSR